MARVITTVAGTLAASVGVYSAIVSPCTALHICITVAYTSLGALLALLWASDIS